jgi:predicted membrane protein
MEPYSKNMVNQNIEKKESDDQAHWGKGRFWAGLIVIFVGSIWLAREAGADIPNWLTGGPIWLVALGLFIGARSNFRNWFWLIPLGVGVALIVDREFWRFNIKPFIWPAVIIAVGLFMMFRPKKKRGDIGYVNWRDHVGKNPDSTNEDDVIDAVSIFGSTKKNILSKDFRGGEVVNFFGGTELNLTQADITKPIVLEMTQVFGGAKLIVPSNWTIHSSELVSVFGGVDDKRMVQANLDPTKILILKGTNVFGGLEIKSY